MGDGTARKFWQIHLLTAVVVMAQVGLLIPIFIEVHESDRASRLVMDVGLYSLVIVCLSIVIVEYTVRAESRKMIQFGVGVALLVLGGVIARTITTPIRIESNHRHAIAACIQFAEAEEIYHRAENFGSGNMYYAQRLDKLNLTPSPGLSMPQSLIECKLISLEFAHAEVPPGPAIPQSGYLFKILKTQGTHATGGVRNYVVSYHHSSYDDNIMTLGYALVAFPNEYAVTGIKTFIINANGRIFEQDLGPNTTKLAREMTEFDPDPSWRPFDLF